MFALNVKTTSIYLDFFNTQKLKNISLKPSWMQLFKTIIDKHFASMLSSNLA